MKNDIKTVQMANAVLLPEIVRLLEEGHTVTLPLRGYSMRPFLEDGRDKALLRKPDSISVGDAVLAEVAPKHYVLHRIVSIKGDHVTLRGDGNINVERCRLSNIKATAVGFYRKGREQLDSTDGRKWRIYSWVWTRLLPIRPYLLFAMHPHVPNRFKKKQIQRKE